MTKQDQQIHTAQNWAAWDQETKQPKQVAERREFADMVTATRLMGILTPADRIRALSL